jgi:NAD(P)-dependent dehydrogenase (short-subunit alcohol dehydrogenase family)
MPRRFVITGGHGNLGSAVMERLARDGEAITVDEKEVDLTDFSATKKWANEVGGPVQGLVALVGGFGMCKLGAMEASDYDVLFDMNVKTAFSTLNAFGDHLSRGAGVILVGSQAYPGSKGMSAYAASKAGVVSLAKSASLEWEGRGIRVNVILPDTIDTLPNRKAMPDANFDKWQKPSEIAEVISFLLSQKAINIKGNALDLGR